MTVTRVSAFGKPEQGKIDEIPGLDISARREEPKKGSPAPSSAQAAIAQANPAGRRSTLLSNLGAMTAALSLPGYVGSNESQPVVVASASLASPVGPGASNASNGAPSNLMISLFRNNTAPSGKPQGFQPTFEHIEEDESESPKPEPKDDLKNDASAPQLKLAFVKINVEKLEKDCFPKEVLVLALYLNQCHALMRLGGSPIAMKDAWRQCDARVSTAREAVQKMSRELPDEMEVAITLLPLWNMTIDPRGKLGAGTIKEKIAAFKVQFKNIALAITEAKVKAEKSSSKYRDALAELFQEYNKLTATIDSTRGGSRPQDKGILELWKQTDEAGRAANNVYLEYRKIRLIQAGKIRLIQTAKPDSEGNSAAGKKE